MDRPRAVIKLKEDEKDLLQEFAAHDSVKVIAKVLEAEMKYMEDQVVQHQMIPERFEELLILKTRAEGARLLGNKFLTRIKELRKRADLLE